MSETKIKSLARRADGGLEDFMANGHKYRAIRPGEPIGIQRWTEFEKLKLVFGFGQTFTAIFDALKAIQDLAAADKPFSEIRTEIILSVNSMLRGITDLSQARYNKALYLASVFIVREGDDIRSWDTHLAEQYIQDWAEEGLSEQDFFYFAGSVTNTFAAKFNQMNDEVSRERERLSAISSTK